MNIKGRIIRKGMGGFLNPPTHPEHDWCVETDLRRRPEKRGSMRLSSAADCEWLDPTTRAAAKQLLSSWPRPPLESVHDWVLQVLGYFRDCYNGATSWAADRLVIDRELDPIINANQHAGVHFIRNYYPEYVPTPNDFTNAYWGNK